MKNFLILFVFSICFNTFGQEGYTKYASKFYSIIDSSRKLECCDTCNYGISISYDIPLLEFPYDKVDFDDYEAKHSEDDYIMFYVENLVNSYYQIKPSIRSKITKSCFNITSKYNVSKDVTNDGLYWVEGTLSIRFIFQTDDPDFGKSWWRKLFVKIKH